MSINGDLSTSIIRGCPEKGVEGRVGHGYGSALEDVYLGYQPQRQLRQECEMHRDSSPPSPHIPNQRYILLGLITLGRCCGSGWEQLWINQDTQHPTTLSMLLSWDMDKSMKWLQRG